MVTSLIKHERIKTTVPKAKELQRFAAKMMRYAKYEGVPARRLSPACSCRHSPRRRACVADRQHGWRLAFRYVRDKEAMTKLFDELAPRYAYAAHAAPAAPAVPAARHWLLKPC